jgi:hypothetical protein
MIPCVTSNLVATSILSLDCIDPLLGAIDGAFAIIVSCDEEGDLDVAVTVQDVQNVGGVFVRTIIEGESNSSRYSTVVYYSYGNSRLVWI